MTKKERRQKIGRISDKFIYWIGSRNSLVVHTIFFGVMILLAFSNIGFDKVMLVLTTIVSLEAIYLSIFIQMTVNKHAEELEEVSEDIDEIQEDVEGIEKDIDEIQKDVDEIQEDVDEIEKKDEEEEHIIGLKNNGLMLARVEESLGKLIEEVVAMKKQYTAEEKKETKKKKK